jgi:predicted lipoprotein with Yx(FWY)xxD motif
MSRALWIAGLLLQPALAPATLAQPAQKPAADAAPAYPAGVKVRHRPTGYYLANARGMTLYTLNQRVAFPRTAGVRDRPLCIESCATRWTEFTAPRGAQPIGDWKVAPGANGPQWTYRNNPVFTHVADRKPGDLSGDEAEDMWNVIVHVPPAPKLAAPAIVVPQFLDGAYYLADPEGHALFVPAKACAADCAEWTPLLAGFAARDVGEWRVAREGARAAWLWRGKPVFVSQETKTAAVPPTGQLLRPATGNGDRK